MHCERANIQLSACQTDQSFGLQLFSPDGSELIRFTSFDSSQFGVRAQYSTIGSASSPQNN